MNTTLFVADTIGNQSASQKVRSKEQFSDLLDLYSDNILYYAILLAAVATLTMALVELVKGLIRARELYHRSAVRNWTGAGAILDELHLLAIGNSMYAGALYDQPTEKMMGQLQAASNIAMDFPHIYPHFYEFLTSLSGTAVTNSQAKNDAAIWAEFAREIDPTYPSARNVITEKTAPEENHTRAATQARARLDNLVNRRLDAFQLRTEFKWARMNQLVSILSASILIFMLLNQLKEGRGIVINLLLAIAGGLIAPFAKDVVSALSGLRTKK